jgi:hypothetical protein
MAAIAPARVALEGVPATGDWGALGTDDAGAT